MIRLVLLIPVLLLFGFSPEKTRPLYYEGEFDTALTIFPNCRDDGFSFTLVQGDEDCAEMIRGSVRAGKEHRYTDGELVLVFKHKFAQIEITEEGHYTHGASCGQFTGMYKRVSR